MNKTILFITVAAASGIGFAAAITVHLFALFGTPLREGSPLPAILHVGIFAAIIPVIIIRRRENLEEIIRRKKEEQSTAGTAQMEAGSLRKRQKRPSLKVQLQALFRGMPPWFLGLSIIFFAYAVINWFLFLANSGGGGPHIMDGQYVIANHGDIIRVITPEEYELARANEIRGFSGHWMLFYVISLGVFLGRVRAAADKTIVNRI